MKKEDIDRILKEADSKLGNLTDKQLQQYTSETHKKQNKERASKGGKIGGKVTYKKRNGLFSMSDKSKKKAQTNGGKVQGKINVETGHVVTAGKISAKSKKHPNNVKVKCEHCGFKTSLPLYKRWHGDNCKHK